jgi:thiol:disulfide interchange protein DsbC
MKSRVATLLAVAIGALSTLARADDPADTALARDLLKGVESMRRLPVDGFHLVEAQGHILIVSTNGHYAILGGRVLDLWNQLEIHKASDVDATLKLPLARMGIKTADLGGISVGRSDAVEAITVFLDPGSPRSQEILPELQSLAKRYKLDVVYVPAQDSRAAVARALICDHRAGESFFATGQIPRDVASSPSCGERELERARITVHLLGIDVLPYTVAPDGTPIAGHPKNYLDQVTAKVGGRP